MIEIKGLTKRFGDFTAVDHLDLTIHTGEFFGLLGPNGAGKTTTISMMSTVLLPTEGGSPLTANPSPGRPPPRSGSSASSPRNTPCART